MAETPSYCSECYNAHVRVNDAQIQAAEGVGKTPMTSQGHAPDAATRRS